MKSDKKFDDAYKFIHQVEEIPEVDCSLASIYRKIDLRILPLLSTIYFLQFLDKSLLNYAGVMGIKDHLDNPSQFSDLGTILYGGYIIFEPMITFGFQKLPFAKLFGTSIVFWGIIVTLHVVCLNYSSLMAIRFLLGGVESTAATGILICNGMWYSHDQQASRFGIITCQVGTATIIGGVLSYAFQGVVGAVLESWQIFFLMMGLITVLFGILVLVVLPDNPMKCKFLNDGEKLILLEHLKGNQTGVENKTFKKDHVIECFCDKQTWVLILLTIVSMIPTGAINTFSVTIIGSFGFNNREAALMQMPVGISSILAIMISMYTVSYSKRHTRTIIFICLLTIGSVGYIIMITTKNRVANLIAVYCGNAGTCAITLIYSWNNRNTAGYTKRLVRNCCTMICIAIGSMIGPQLFKSDAPRYLPAKISLLCISIVSMVIVSVLAMILRQENHSRDKRTEQEKQDFYEEYGQDYQFKDLTDIQNLYFRYDY